MLSLRSAALATFVSLLLSCAQQPDDSIERKPRFRAASAAEAVADPFTNDGRVAVLAPEGGAWETTVAVSPVNPNIVLATSHIEIDYQTGDYIARIFRSTDGGRTFDEGRIPPMVIDGTEYKSHYDPVLTFARNGTAYFTAIHAWPNVYFATRYAMVVQRSTDGGLTWTPSLISKHDPPAGGTEALDYPDKEWLAVDNSGGPTDGHVYLTWIHIDSRFNDRARRLDVRVVRSTDGGVTWSAPTSIGPYVMPYITVGANGEVYHATADVTGWELRTSRDGGATFSAPTLIAPMSGTGVELPHTKYSAIPHHHLVADASHGPGRGNLYFIYPSGSGATEKERPASVKFKRSTDGGATWSAPLTLSAPQLGRDAHMPSIASDVVTGEVVASWMDRQHDPENKLAKVFAARSRDGGATFGPAIAITPAFSMGGPWIGDYNHTAAAGGTHIASFADEGGHFSTARATWSESAPRRRSVRK
jgi:hypothetical protein